MSPRSVRRWVGNNLKLESWRGSQARIAPGASLSGVGHGAVSICLTKIIRRFYRFILINDDLMPSKEEIEPDYDDVNEPKFLNEYSLLDNLVALF